MRATEPTSRAPRMPRVHRYERMVPIDQDAIRREPEAWSMLTDGGATLKRQLLDILWQEDDFEPHKTELLDLLTRFGLIVPVPRKIDTWIVPALLRETTRPEAPLGWPARPANAARLLLHFTLDSDATGGMWRRIGQADAASDDSLAASLLYNAEAGGATHHGFLPIGVFHRLCAGALGCSSQVPHISHAVPPSPTPCSLRPGSMFAGLLPRLP